MNDSSHSDNELCSEASETYEIVLNPLITKEINHIWNFSF